MAQKGSISVTDRIETTNKWFGSLPSQITKRKAEAKLAKENGKGKRKFRKPYKK